MILRSLLILALAIGQLSPEIKVMRRRAHAVGGGGPVTQTGSILQFGISDEPTGTVSTTITVPADATFAVVGITSWKSGVTNFFSGGVMTFTKGGTDTAMVAVQSTPRGDGSDAISVAMFYIVLPDTGSNKSLKWDWQGTEYASLAPLVSVSFWKSVNTTTPIRGTGGVQSGALPYTTGTITAQSGDLIIAYSGSYATSEGTVDSWSNLTELSELTRYATGNVDGAWATSSPSGDTTVAASTGTNWSEGALVAIAVRPAP